MHIAEGFLPPAHAVAWTVAAAPFVIHGGYRVVKLVREKPEARLLLGAAGAFTFVLSAIKLPSVTGSSSHPTGTGIGAILFRPPVMAFLSTIVLIFQALLLAHGGITTLGANVFSMGVVGPGSGTASSGCAGPCGHRTWSASSSGSRCPTCRPTASPPSSSPWPIRMRPPVSPARW